MSDDGLSSLVEAKNALVVIAHPDDECMFFGPSIQWLRANHKQVHLICLTEGNYYGLGKLRRKELFASANVYGISSENVRVIDDPGLQDGSGASWMLETAVDLIKKYIESNKIDLVLSFDEHGVSGHRDHFASFQAVRSSLENIQTPTKWLLLRSETLVSKYTGWLFAAYHRHGNSNNDKNVVSAGNAITLISDHPERNRTAMACHTSQLVWFRRLFVIFSRYMYANTLTTGPVTH